MGTATEWFRHPLRREEGGVGRNTHLKENNRKAIAENYMLNKHFHIYRVNLITTD